MNIIEFLDAVDDKQKIFIGDSSILSFTNSGGDLFCIPSEDIRKFFAYFYNNYEDLYKVWSDSPERKDSIKIYEEKSFRKLYLAVEDIEELRSVSTLGKSQTKSLTQLLSKLICYFSNLDYSSCSKNTLFEKKFLKLAVLNWGDFYGRTKISDSTTKESIRTAFKNWLIENGSSEKTASSYAQTTLSKADEILVNYQPETVSILLMTSQQIDKADDWLDSQPEWKKANMKGNGMYASGLSKFKQFKEGFKPPSEITAQLPKPFLLLAGISGTGKSRFVREQAKLHNKNMANFCLVAVRPDWHEPSDLLGYVSRLSGTASYVATDVLRFMVAAWKSLIDDGLQLSGSQGQTLIGTTGDQLDAVVPYWLCLDEMNLAPVEQYFADYLAMIETRNWEQEGDTYNYRCDALLKASVLSELNQEGQENLASNLGLGNIEQGGADHELWQHFLDHGIAIPPNLIVAGTVNMDETTHGFSRKVIDRAMSFDFGEFFPNKFDDFYNDGISHVPLSFPRHSSGRLAVPEAQAQPSIEVLQAVNSVLKGSSFELAFRALNELLLAVHCHGAPTQGARLQAVWDDF